MTLRRHARSVFAMARFELVVAIVQCRHQMRGRSGGFTAAGLAIVNDQNRAAIASHVKGDRQSGDACANDADIDAGIRVEAGKGR